MVDLLATKLLHHKSVTNKTLSDRFLKKTFYQKIVHENAKKNLRYTILQMKKHCGEMSKHSSTLLSFYLMATLKTTVITHSVDERSSINITESQLGTTLHENSVF
jgi:hypothetical protein